jgi:RNA polymerase sigma factor (sigma-70 family)
MFGSTFGGDKLVKMEDWRLLQQYARDGSESAFTELVNRQMDLVYSTALRRLKDPQAAQDVSQSVFSLLAQKAHQLRSDTAFVSWLYRTTCYKAAKYWRAECRRKKREDAVAYMQGTEPPAENEWDSVLPHLDEAIAELSEGDRLAVLLRFFQRKSLKEVGMAFGIGEDAARMRVNRTLEKLQGALLRKGVAISALALGTEMTSKMVQATPLDRARVVLEVATQAAKTASVPSLVTTFLILMANTKFKMGVGVALVVLAGGTWILLTNRTVEIREVEVDHIPIATGRQPEMSVQERKVQALLGRTIEGTERAQEQPSLIANLQQALRQEAVISEGNAFSYPVASAVVAFGADRSLAIPTLLEAIRDTNELVRMNAYLGMAYLDEAGKDAMPQLLEWATDRNEHVEVRLAAMNGLDNIVRHDPSLASEILREYVEMLNDPNFTLRGTAARSLGSMGSYSKDAVPALTDLLSYSAQREDAAAQLRLDGRTDTEIGEDRINQKMASLTRAVRISGAEALQGIGPEASSAIPMLELLLRDADKDVRAAVAIALWKIAGRTDGITAIIESLSPGSSRMYEGLDALGEMGPAAGQAIGAVTHLTRFVNPEIRDPAVAALNKIVPAAATHGNSRQ